MFSVAASYIGFTTKINDLGSFNVVVLRRGRYITPQQVRDYYRGRIEPLKTAVLIGFYRNNLGTVVEIECGGQRYHSDDPTNTLADCAVGGGLGPFCALSTPIPIQITPYIVYKVKN